VILYLDTSAFAKLVLTEPETAMMRDLFNRADYAVTSVITYPEASSALYRQDHVLATPLGLARRDHTPERRPDRIRRPQLGDFGVARCDMKAFPGLSAAEVLAEMRFEFGDAHDSHGRPLQVAQLVLSANVNRSVHDCKEEPLTRSRRPRRGLRQRSAMSPRAVDLPPPRS
jgi:hypothetical protein